MTTHVSTLSNPAASSVTGSRTLRATLWIVQALLALAFGFAGGTKAFAPLAEAAKSIPWIPDVPAALVRFSGLPHLRLIRPHGWDSLPETADRLLDAIAG